MLAIGGKLSDLPCFNHGIIIKYADGIKNFAPPHRDHSEDTGGKTACLKKGAGFSVISVGEPRTFQLLDSAAGPVVKEWKLPRRSVLHIPAEFNVAYWHAVPKDSNHNGVRCSLIFREILVPPIPSSSSASASTRAAKRAKDQEEAQVAPPTAPRSKKAKKTDGRMGLCSNVGIQTLFKIASDKSSMAEKPAEDAD